MPASTLTPEELYYLNTMDGYPEPLKALTDDEIEEIFNDNLWEVEDTDIPYDVEESSTSLFEIELFELPY